jgi:hypothetical protein
MLKKTKVMKISRAPSPLHSIIDQKQEENVEYFQYLGSMITKDARCTREIKSWIVKSKSSIQPEEDSLHQQIGLIFKEENSEVLHLEHSIIWC